MRIGGKDAEPRCFSTTARIEFCVTYILNVSINRWRRKALHKLHKRIEAETDSHTPCTLSHLYKLEANVLHVRRHIRKRERGCCTQKYDVGSDAQCTLAQESRVLDGMRNHDVGATLGEQAARPYALESMRICGQWFTHGLSLTCVLIMPT
jgi:hypothetical protein